jgi:hypothetical protein
MKEQLHLTVNILNNFIWHLWKNYIIFELHSVFLTIFFVATHNFAYNYCKLQTLSQFTKYDDRLQYTHLKHIALFAYVFNFCRYTGTVPCFVYTWSLFFKNCSNILLREWKETTTPLSGCLRAHSKITECFSWTKHVNIVLWGIFS